MVALSQPYTGIGPNFSPIGVIYDVGLIIFELCSYVFRTLKKGYAEEEDMIESGKDRYEEVQSILAQVRSERRNRIHAYPIQLGQAFDDGDILRILSIKWYK